MLLYSTCPCLFRLCQRCGDRSWCFQDCRRSSISISIIHESVYTRSWQLEEYNSNVSGLARWHLVRDCRQQAALAENDPRLCLQLLGDLPDCLLLGNTVWHRRLCGRVLIPTPIVATLGCASSNDFHAWGYLDLRAECCKKYPYSLVRLHATFKSNPLLYRNRYRAHPWRPCLEHASYNRFWLFLPALMADIPLWEIFESKSSGWGRSQTS